MGTLARLVWTLAAAVATSACATAEDSMRTPGPATIGEGAGSTGRETGSTSGASADAESTAGPASASDDGVCAPGQQVACACPGGEQGAQSCAADGNSFLPCECPEPPATTGTGGETTGATSTGQPQGECGRLDCQSCLVCVQESRGRCSESVANCLALRECVSLNECLGNCMDAGCQEACTAKAGKEAVAAYNDFTTCVVGVCTRCDGG